jgi:hypothetical protein
MRWNFINGIREMPGRLHQVLTRTAPFYFKNLLNIYPTSLSFALLFTGLPVPECGAG